MSVYKQYFEKNTGREFPIYGYSPPPQGEWWLDDTVFTTEDFRTVEKYKEYKDCGFNVLFLQHSALYKGEGWENSETKMAFDNALAAGIEKIILVDDRIFQLSLIPEGIIGDGTTAQSSLNKDRTARRGAVSRRNPFAPYNLGCNFLRNLPTLFPWRIFYRRR